MGFSLCNNGKILLMDDCTLLDNTAFGNTRKQSVCISLLSSKEISNFLMSSCISEYDLILLKTFVSNCSNLFLIVFTVA